MDDVVSFVLHFWHVEHLVHFEIVIWDLLRTRVYQVLLLQGGTGFAFDQCRFTWDFGLAHHWQRGRVAGKNWGVHAKGIHPLVAIFNRRSFKGRFLSVVEGGSVRDYGLRIRRVNSFCLD